MIGVAQPRRDVTGGPIRLRGAVAVGLAALLSTGCGSAAPDLPAPSPDAAVRAHCAQALAALPDRVGGNTGLVNTEKLIAYYGEGEAQVVVRCGVTKPAELTTTSRCDEINGIGWFAQEQATNRYIFTTIGRAGFLEVRVGPGHQPAGDVLNELTPVAAAIPVITPCQ